MAFSWIRNLGVAALIAAAGLAAKSLPGDATSIAWFPAGLAFALVALRREALLPGAAVGLFAAAMLQEHWLIAAATAVLSVAAGYVAGFVYAPLAQGKHGTLPSAITAIVLGLVLFALPIAFCQIGLKALVVPDEHVQADMAPRVMRDAGGMAISRDLTLGSSPTLQASAEQKQSPQTRTIVSLMLAVLLLLPAAWVGRGAGLTRKVRRGFARALVANMLGYALLLWSAAQSAWPFNLSALVLPLCAGILAVITLLTAAFRTQRLSAKKTKLKPGMRDRLTSLQNRDALTADLALAIAHARREREQIAVLLVDLDGCRRANAMLGYEAGDALVRAAAERLGKALTHRCSLYRLESDEFVVVAEAAGEIQPPAEVARHIIDAVGRTVLFDGHELALGCAVGISMFPADAQSAAELVQLAGIACAAAKQDGSAAYVAFSQDVHQKALRLGHLDEALRQAHERDELFVMYQPRASVRSGRCTELEALPCLRQLDGSLIMGSDLIAVARRCGLVGAIGERLIDAVCRQLGAWRERGEQLFPVALAVASEQLRQPQRLVEIVIKSLHENDLAAELLALEVCDFSLAHDSVQAGAALRELDALGVRVVAAAFGAAGGTLTRLVHLPLRGVALDESLLVDSNEPRARTLLRSLVSMGHGLQCSVLAKGVTTQEQLECLLESAADYYQGGLLSGPLPADEVEQFLMQHHRVAFVAHVGQVRSAG